MRQPTWTLPFQLLHLEKCWAGENMKVVVVEVVNHPSKQEEVFTIEETAETFH